MAITTDTLWLDNGGSGEGSNNRLAATQPSNTNQGAANFGTSTAARWLQLKGNGSTSGAGDASPQEGVDGGWNVPLADMHDVGATNSRLIKAGVWTIRLVISDSVASLSSNYAEAAYVYRRASDGTLTLLFSVTSSNHAVGVGQAAYTLTSASQPKCLFAPGETLQVEVWARGVGVAITGQIRTLRRGTGGLGGSVQVEVPGGGIFNSFSRASSDAAPASDTMDEVYAADRPISDATTLTESPARELAVARSVGDNGPVVDVLARALSFPRTLDDIAPSTDGGAQRALVVGREAADAVTGLDALLVSFDGNRQLADTLALTETAARQFVGARPLLDAVPTPAEELDRVVTANRDIDDTLSTDDAPVRAVSLGRSLADDAPATDALGRAINANRGISDVLTTGGGVVRRNVFIVED